MVQGDKYSYLIQIKKGDTVITSSNCDGVKVQIGNLLKTSTSGLTFDSTQQKWLFPLTQAETLALPGSVPASVQIKIGTSIYTSEIQTLNVGTALIKEEWT